MAMMIATTHATIQSSSSLNDNHYTPFLVAAPEPARRPVKARSAPLTPSTNEIREVLCLQNSRTFQ